MTVSYQYDVASSTSGGFIRLLFRWRGSVWKLVYHEMFFFTAAYFTLTMFYRFLFTDFQKRIFERLVFLCSTFMDLIPLSFVLGFYVSFIATRWWNQYTAIPWPDKFLKLVYWPSYAKWQPRLMNSISMYVPGVDETSRVLRRTLMRYLNVALVLVLRSISMAVKRRFPTRDHLVEAGFMTKLELEMLNSVPSTEFNTFWIPCTWFINLLREAKQECRITDSNGLKLIMEEFNEFRSKCGLLWSYDWISIPLVYTQVVTLATYAFFGACIFGRQFVESPEKPDHNFEYYIPIFTIFQLFFYMGLLKVAEQLINPFGDDDEDFELNWIIDRHMKVSYLGVDVLNTNPPPLVRDNYFYQQDMKLPYTQASVGYKKKTYRGSVARMQIPQEKQNLLVPEFSEDDDEDKIAATLGLGNRGASLWTLVGGKLNTRFSVSNQNLDTVTLESGSNDWKVSNPSLFLSPTNGVCADGKRASSATMGFSQLQVPDENSLAGEPAETPSGPPQVLSLCKSPEKRKEALVKRMVKKVKKPHIRRKAPQAPHPPNKWVAFQAAPGREDTHEVLSLFKRVPQSIDDRLQSSMTSPSLCLQGSTDRRRQSFDERSITMTFKDKAQSSRFQSLPDVKRFAAEAGVVVADEWEDLPPEDQDNLSTSNLLILKEVDSEEEADLPRLTFTRASMSPCPSSSDTASGCGSQDLVQDSEWEAEETRDRKP